MSFTLAHLSDVHLANTTRAMMLKHFQPKRVIGGFSWFGNRRKFHLGTVADSIRDSIMAARPDHIALTGDLVNLGAPHEFEAAAKWVAGFGPADQLTIVPGNHDAYVPLPWRDGLARFEPWMTSDRAVTTDPASPFPFLRMRRTTVLIGVSTAQPQNYKSANGTVGPEQLRDLAHLLNQLGQQGFYRVVLIHHPPLPNLAPARKALTDAAELKAVLAEEGCELVLHGHNHTNMQNWLDTKGGPVPVIGVSSASASGKNHHEAAAWNLYAIRRQQGRWMTDVTRHSWNPETALVEAGKPVTLSPP